MRAKKDGLARDIGVSNYAIDLIEILIKTTGETPTVNQIEWSPFGWAAEMLEGCRDRGIVIQAWSPLTRTRRLDDDRVVDLAARYGKSPAQLLLRWNLQLGTVPLPKANQRGHLVENLDVFDFEIDREHLAELDRLNEHYSALGSLSYV
jgi:2,5-diketo-D-gluconate reductase A